MASGYSNRNDHGYANSSRDQHFFPERNSSRLEDRSEITSQREPQNYQKRHGSLYTRHDLRTPDHSNQERYRYRHPDEEQYYRTEVPEISSARLAFESTTISHSRLQVDLQEHHQNRQHRGYQGDRSRYRQEPKDILQHSEEWLQPGQQCHQQHPSSQEVTPMSYPTHQHSTARCPGFYQYDTRPLAHHGIQDKHFSDIKNPAPGDKKLLLREELCSRVDNYQNIYVANHEFRFIDDKNFLRKLTIGQETAIQNQPHKVVMLLGETGSGKSPLINAMFNYIMGVEFEDNFRLNLIHQSKSDNEAHANQAKSQTKWITSYTIHHRDGFTIPFKLTIIDTPGFGDTDGIQRDKEITKQITKFFKKEGSNGIDAIDAVGFVAQSSQSRLTATQRYIFDSILSLFGKDIQENISCFYHLLMEEFLKCSVH